MHKPTLILFAFLAALFGNHAMAQGQISWQPSQIEALAEWVERAPDEAIKLPANEAARIRVALNEGTPQQRNQIATKAALQLMKAYRGRCCGSARLPRWHISTEFSEAIARSQLQEAVEAGKVDAFLRSQSPSHPEYRALARAYLRETDEQSRSVLARNLSRWRTLPIPARSRYLIVNIAQQSVTLWDGNVAIDKWRVIVGKCGSPTPVFQTKVTGVVLNPWWEIPPSIAAEGIGAFVRRSPAAARAKGYIRSGSRYRQMPGDNNALGRMKLVMPSAYSVLLHDTSNRDLFAGEDRALSHGCVRVDKALNFAATLLGENGWTQADVDAVVAANTTRTVQLAKPIPIFIAYFTAVPDHDGGITYLPDIYGRDR